MSVKWRREADTDEVLDAFKQAYGNTSPDHAELVVHPDTVFDFTDEELKLMRAQLLDLKIRLRDPGSGTPPPTAAI